MSEDEVCVLIPCIGVAFVCWVRWYWNVTAVSRLHSSQGERLLLHLAPWICAGVLWGVLRAWASFDVVGDPIYLGFYMTMGAAWVGLAAMFLPLFGVSPKEDVVERRNAGAAWTIVGALVGFTLCFAGANIGDGPGWWVVVFAGGLSTITLALLWILYDRATGVSEHVTVDRDPASGARLGGLLVALGIVLGRGSAGDWHGAAATVIEFLEIAWAAPLLVAGAMLVERAMKPTPEKPVREIVGSGFVPSVGFLTFAGGVALAKGMWS